uniref:Uncharacterized protein n=1 Tax=Lotus japonicus TaxID=34305 RepID=I3T5K7_LOTJA|nr:unknown [Lotus japonicus]
MVPLTHVPFPLSTRCHCWPPSPFLLPLNTTAPPPHRGCIVCSAHEPPPYTKAPTMATPNSHEHASTTATAGHHRHASFHERTITSSPIFKAEVIFPQSFPFSCFSPLTQRTNKVAYVKGFKPMLLVFHLVKF